MLQKLNHYGLATKNRNRDYDNCGGCQIGRDISIGLEELYAMITLPSNKGIASAGVLLIDKLKLVEQQLQVQKGEQSSGASWSWPEWFWEYEILALPPVAAISAQGITLNANTTRAIMEANNFIAAK